MLLQIMKLALKYGIFVTLVIAAWVALKHFVLHLESRPAQFVDVAIFNLTAIAGLALGIREKRTINGGTLTFSEGLITGIKIGVTYAILIRRAGCPRSEPLIDRQCLLHQTSLLLCVNRVAACGGTG